MSVRYICSLCVIVSALFLAGCTPPEEPKPPEPPPEPPQPPQSKPIVYLEQGWNADERHDFYYLTQGSQLVPYYWFLALETDDSNMLFRDDEHMRSLGYITQPPEPRRNPDGLPIGFVKDDNPQTVETTYAMKKAFLGPNYRETDYPSTNAWLGLTCAACHTADIEYKGATVRVDGAPAMADHEGFLGALARALRTTHDNDDKYVRFAKRVLGDSYNEGEAIALKSRLSAYTNVLARLVERNKATHPYGFARLDAFGAILNQVLEAALEVPENRGPSSAPVSFPFLWDTPHLDWVQWNGSADDPLGRNVGEVLGVYAHLQLSGTPETGQFTSTARVDNLFRLEETLQRLQAPAWPVEIFGQIDQAQVTQGQQLFAANCVGCHSVRDENGQFPMTSPNKFGKQFIRTQMVSSEKVGTDPQMVRNFIQRIAEPSALGPHLGLPQVPEKLPAVALLGVAVRGVVERAFAEMTPQLDDEQKLRLTGFRDPERARPSTEHLTSYKARPLNGIWATAPYLHNGSVPNLRQLLLPDEQRVASFSVGSREFDAVNVGFETTPFEGGFIFETRDDEGQPVLGNMNTGHSGPLYTQTKGDDDVWRDFTEDERFALIEYMKTLK